MNAVPQQTKREIADLVPYRMKGDVPEYYLQMRDGNAPTCPNMLATFGGGLEGDETHEQALMREIQEELVYTPLRQQYFSRYEHRTHIHHVYIEEVGADFETKVDVHEGEYGAFFTFAQIAGRADVIPSTRLKLTDIELFLTNKKL